ncbi:hypothetical protein GGF31_006373 [Allomyces arbusculus]|nr:hypothetical protein GGF31_006373 [Allomyces arbusculus]
MLGPGEDGGSKTVIGHVFDGAPPRGPIGDGNDGWEHKTRPRPSPPTRPPPPPEDDPPLPNIPLPHGGTVRIGLPQPPSNPPPAATESLGAGTPEAGSKAEPPTASPTPGMGIFVATEPEARVGTAPGSGGGGGGGGGNSAPSVPVAKSGGGDGAARGGSASVASAAGANVTPASAAAAASSSSGSNGGSNSAWSSSSSPAAGSDSAASSSGSPSSSSWSPSSSTSSSGTTNPDGSTDPDGSRTDTLSPNSGMGTDSSDTLSSPSTRHTLFILAVLVPTVGFVAAASMFAIRAAQRRHTLPTNLLWWRKPATTPAPPARDPSPPAAPRASLSTVSEYSPIVGYGSMHYSHIDLVPLAPPPNSRAIYGGPAVVVAPPPAAAYAPRTRRVLTVERAGARVKDVGPSAGLFPQARPPEAATPTPLAPSVLLAVREEPGETDRRQSSAGPPPLAGIADVATVPGLEMGSSLRNSFRVW